jgi:hypothetical protein
VDDELRKVGVNAYVCWQASRYSVPWQVVERSVWLRERAGDSEVHYGEQRIATHNKTLREHPTVTQPEHHRGIPRIAGAERKILIHIQNMARQWVRTKRAFAQVQCIFWPCDIPLYS